MSRKGWFGKLVDGGKKLVAGFEDGPSSVFQLSDLPGPIAIGNYRVHFTRKLDEGGFSYVYSAVDSQTNKAYAVKRLLIQDREQRAVVNNEIKVMKKIAGHPCLITLYGEKFDRMNDNMVVWLLMELGEDSVIGLINKRLSSLNTRNLDPSQNRGSPQFSERQILRIFYDVCCGISHLHSMQPPIIHRDIKIENVLKVGNIFKMCDFGSCTTRAYNLDLKSERQAAEEDINKNTTMEYRAPEMIDLFSGNGIGTKSDIWALGCLLYKLLFFEGPFDLDEGIRIMSGRYDIPPKSFREREQKFLQENPNTPFTNYSRDLPKLVKSMIRIDPNRRPDIFEILKYVGGLLKLPEKDIPQPPPHLRSEVVPGRISSTPNTPVEEVATTGSPLEITEIRRSGVPKRKKSRGVKKRKKIESLYDQLSKPSNNSSTKKRGFGEPRSKTQVQPDVEGWDPDFGDFDIPEATTATAKTTERKSNNKKKTPSPRELVTQKQQEEEEEMGLFDQLEWVDNSGAGSLQPPSPQPPKKKTPSIPRQNQPRRGGGGGGAMASTLRGQGPLSGSSRPRVQSSPPASSPKDHGDEVFEWMDGDGGGNEDDDISSDSEAFVEHVDEGSEDEFAMDPLMFDSKPQKRQPQPPQPRHLRHQQKRPVSSPPRQKTQRKRSQPPQKQQQRSEEVSMESLLQLDGPSSSSSSSSNLNKNIKREQEQKKKVENDSLIQFDAPPTKPSSFRMPPASFTLGLPDNVHPRTKSFDYYNLPKSLDRLYSQPPQQLRQMNYRAGYQAVHTNGYYRTNTQYLSLASQTRERQVSSDVAFIKQLVSQKKEEMKKSRSTDNFPF